MTTNPPHAICVELLTGLLPVVFGNRLSHENLPASGFSAIARISLGLDSPFSRAILAMRWPIPSLPLS